MSRPDHIRGEITPEVVADVRRIVEESVRHSYSVSRIFAAHNLIFNRRDTPQTCSTCLRNRVRDLRRWLAEYDAASATPEAAPEEAEARPKRRARKTGQKAAPKAAEAEAPEAAPEEDVPDPVEAAGGIADYSSLL